MCASESGCASLVSGVPEHLTRAFCSESCARLQGWSPAEGLVFVWPVGVPRLRDRKLPKGPGRPHPNGRRPRPTTTLTLRAVGELLPAALIKLRSPAAACGRGVAPPHSAIVKGYRHNDPYKRRPPPLTAQPLRRRDGDPRDAHRLAGRRTRLPRLARKGEAREARAGGAPLAWATLNSRHR